MNKKDIEKKLNKEFTKNPDFVFYDYENECVGNDLLELTYSLLAQQKEDITHQDIVKEIKIALKSSYNLLPQSYEGYANKYNYLISYLRDIINKNGKNN